MRLQVCGHPKRLTDASKRLRTHSLDTVAGWAAGCQVTSTIVASSHSSWGSAERREPLEYGWRKPRVSKLLGVRFGAPWGLCWAVWRPLGPSWGPLGALLGPLGGLLGPPGSSLGRKARIFGSWSPSWAPLGAVLGPSWAVLGCLGRLLGGLDALLGRLGRLFGASKAVLGRSWGPLGPSSTLCRPKNLIC